jgi:hypothetical protein
MRKIRIKKQRKMDARKTIKMVIPAAILAGVILISGCTVTDEPRVRLGSYATATPGTNFIDSNNLGRHSYGSLLFENNGIVYTCRGGHVDIAHVRIGADNVRYLYYKTKKNLISGKRDFTFKLNVEPSTYFVRIYYPPGWKKMSRKERAAKADELAMELSQYFTFTMTTWHEVLTWFGYKCMAILPEEPSAFSWEDIYSNLVGIRIGAAALRDSGHGYDKAVTIALKDELEKLGVQSSTTARKASEKMRGIWYDGTFLVNMKERNLDIGLDDGYVTPVLVPGVGVCEGVEALSYPVPTLEKFDGTGFRMRLEVEPREFEKGKVLKIVYPNGGYKRIQPTKHIGEYVEYIRSVIKSKGWHAEGGEQIVRKTEDRRQKTENGKGRTLYRTKGIGAAGNQGTRISEYQETGKKEQRTQNAESLSIAPKGENSAGDVGVVNIGSADGVEAGGRGFK